MGNEKMDNATRHRRLAWIGGISLVVLFVVVAICSPESIRGQMSMSEIIRDIVVLVLIIYAFSVIKRKKQGPMA